MKCPKCGTEFDSNFCPNCGFAKIVYVDMSHKRQPLTCQTWFIVLMLILFFPVGLILMWKNKKSWDAILKVVITICSILFFFVSAFIVLLIDVSTEYMADQTETDNSHIEAPDVEKDNIIDVEIDDCDVKYIRSELGVNYVGEECLIIYYEFTNNSDENKCFDLTVDDKTFQNGIELESSFYHANEESKDSSLEIKPGVTITVASSFIPRDDSAVTLEVGRWPSKKAKDEMTIELK